VIHLINYDIVNQQDFLEKGFVFLHFYSMSINIDLILDFDIFVKNLLFQHVVMVQVIINIYVFIQLMIIHQQQRAVLFILLIQLNNNSIETILFFFLNFWNVFFCRYVWVWMRQRNRWWFFKKIRNRKIKRPVHEN